MKDIISMLIEKDLLVVVILGIIIILFLILFVVLLITDKNRNKTKNETMNDEKIDISNITKPNKEEIISKEENILEEEIIESDEIEEDIEENKENISDIADVLASMQAHLDERDQKVIDIFEQEQEENAIISYQELVKACKKNTEKEVVTEPKKEIKEEIKKEEPIKKFKKSEFISPIYGKEKKNNDSLEPFLDKKNNKKEEFLFEEEERNIEPEFNLEDLQKEMKDNEEFLEELKSFRDSL